MSRLADHASNTTQIDQHPMPLTRKVSQYGIQRHLECRICQLCHLVQNLYGCYLLAHVQNSRNPL